MLFEALELSSSFLLALPSHQGRVKVRRIGAIGLYVATWDWTTKKFLWFPSITNVGQILKWIYYKEWLKEKNWLKSQTYITLNIKQYYCKSSLLIVNISWFENLINKAKYSQTIKWNNIAGWQCFCNISTKMIFASPVSYLLEYFLSSYELIGCTNPYNQRSHIVNHFHMLVLLGSS